MNISGTGVLKPLRAQHFGVVYNHCVYLKINCAVMLKWSTNGKSNILDTIKLCFGIQHIVKYQKLTIVLFQ